MKKVQSYLMLVLLNITIEPSNLSEKNKRIIECDKSTITQSDVILVLSNVMMV